MNGASRGRKHAAIAVLAVGALALTACSSGGGGTPSSEASKKAPKAADSLKQYATTKIGTAADSKGPAAPVPGAKSGGVLNTFEATDFIHYDPAQIYVSNQGDLNMLLQRGLTNYKMSDDGKQYTLVGDLAEDTGTQSDGGKTWTYKLKSGIKWQDGTDITSADIQWSMERTFADFITQGPTYIQQWLANVKGAAYRKFYTGPYGGKSLPKTSIETPDKQTIVFHFKTPQSDLPFALAMPGYSAVEKAKDTKAKYDKAPQASGPYKIKKYTAGKGIVLEKNTAWDPNTDPVRHQYLDGFNMTFNHDAIDTSNRLISDSGENASAISLTNAVDASLTQKAHQDPSASKRMVVGYQPYSGVINFNMDRLKDIKIRKAIALAVPIKQILGAAGGADGGELAGSYISPTIAGFKNIDPYGKLKKPEGDPVAAKKLLQEAGKVGMKLSYAYANSPANQQSSVAVANALKAAGFDVQRKELPRDTYYDLVGEVGSKNTFDIYASAWGADWPSAKSVIPPLYDGRTIAKGANNYAHLNDPKVNSEIDRIDNIADPAAAAAEWFKLGEYILKTDLPAIPTYNYRQMQLAGSKVGGVVYNNVLSYIDPTRLYLK